MRVVKRSSGSFLCPPGHPMLSHGIEDGPWDNPSLIAGLDYALKNEYGDVPERIRAQVQKLYDEATWVESELWLENVYGYFRNCYAPENGDRNVSNCIVWREPKPAKEGEAPEIVPAKPPAERSLAFLHIRQYFPDHRVRPDLLDRKDLYGTKPCEKCGGRLQYEASVDAFAEAITARRECPEGGLHEPGTKP